MNGSEAIGRNGGKCHRIVVIDGPNMSNLGVRSKKVYGAISSLDAVKRMWGNSGVVSAWMWRTSPPITATSDLSRRDVVSPAAARATLAALHGPKLPSAMQHAALIAAGCGDVGGTLAA